MMKNIVQGLPYRSWVFIAALIFMLGIGAILTLRVVGVRKFLPAKHPDEAMILSAQGNQDDTLESDCLKGRLAPLDVRNEVLSENGPDEIYALFCCSSSYPFVGEDDLVVRVRGERAILTWYEDKARAIYREMTTNELEELRSFIRKHSIDDLGSVSDIEGCSSGKCMTTYEYLHAKREGVKRLSISIADNIPNDPGKNPYRKLIDLFRGLTRSGKFKACYRMADKIKGVEALHVTPFSPGIRGQLTEDGQYYNVIGVCKPGPTISVLVATGRGINMTTEWRDFSRGVIGDKLEPNTDCQILSRQKYDVYIPPGFKPDGYQPQPGGGMKFLIVHRYKVATPDGTWIADVQNKGGYFNLVAISPKIGREHKVPMPKNRRIEVITYIPAHNKILVKVEVETYRDHHTEYRLVDHLTGKNEKVTGEFRPLITGDVILSNIAEEIRQRIPGAYSGLQPTGLPPTGRPNEFWAAIASKDETGTEIGRYDTRKFVFKPIIKLPLSFNEIWVDEAEGKIYIVYRGHLLRLPLKQ